MKTYKNIITLKQELERGEISREEFQRQAIEYSITRNHTGKMTGLLSTSTAPQLNPFCRINCQRKGSPCEHCFSLRQQKRYKEQANKLEQCFEFYTTEEISPAAVPFINCCYFRFEAFGDICTPLQFKNYTTIAKKNPACSFALWTKNPKIIKEALEIYGNIIPRNLIIIYSSPMLNIKVNLEQLQKVYPFINKTFTVYKKPEDVQKAGERVNCGGLRCEACGFQCYKKSTSKAKNERIELLK